MNVIDVSVSACPVGLSMWDCMVGQWKGDGGEQAEVAEGTGVADEGSRMVSCVAGRMLQLVKSDTPSPSFRPAPLPCSMVLCDDLDGNGRLDLLVTTMNGNV